MAAEYHSLKAIAGAVNIFRSTGSYLVNVIIDGGDERSPEDVAVALALEPSIDGTVVVNVGIADPAVMAPALPVIAVESIRDALITEDRKIGRAAVLIAALGMDDLDAVQTFSEAITVGELCGRLVVLVQKHHVPRRDGDTGFPLGGHKWFDRFDQAFNLERLNMISPEQMEAERQARQDDQGRAIADENLKAVSSQTLSVLADQIEAGANTSEIDKQLFGLIAGGLFWEFSAKLWTDHGHSRRTKAFTRSLDAACALAVEAERHFRGREARDLVVHAIRRAPDMNNLAPYVCASILLAIIEGRARSRAA